MWIRLRKMVLNVYRSFPIQLLLLHFRRYQILLIIWLILFKVVTGSFLKSFGADSLFLAPEYLGVVNSLSAGIVGIATGIFFMSWNITTFILHSRHFKFLAATNHPFLKYCINNAILPVLFLIVYLLKGTRYAHDEELMPWVEVWVLAGGFLTGLILILTVSFFYFFGAHRTIQRTMRPDPMHGGLAFLPLRKEVTTSKLLQVEWFFNGLITVKKPRDVSHYSTEFLDRAFGRHNFSAVLSILIAFIFLVVVGFLLDNPIFQLPAAASILVLFAILISFAGAVTYFLQSWSIPVAIGAYVILNLLFKQGYIDPRNKAYGLFYPHNASSRAKYDKETLAAMVKPEWMQADSLHWIGILNKWKAKQKKARPYLVLLNVSGGGTRSATFSLSMLQSLDSALAGDLLHRCFLITGASGGMFGATYYRELFRRKQNGESINLRNAVYVNDIAGDLLNPLFSSLVARDLASPAQWFTVSPYRYAKDRAYAFEEKFNQNTRGYLSGRLKEYQQEEFSASIPLMVFNSVITADSRKLMWGTQPMRCFMQPKQFNGRMLPAAPDAIDAAAWLKAHDPMNLRLLTALRMNATFPYVLPNVWLPSEPIVDVMDAGLRDNFGQDFSLRFLHLFNQWIKQETAGVVLLQLRDQPINVWELPEESADLSELLTKPFLILQNNWHRMQEFSQQDQIRLATNAFDFPFYILPFQYLPSLTKESAALSLHLTKAEKQDIAAAVHASLNQKHKAELIKLLR